MFIVRLSRLQFYGFHGVPDAERVIGHQYFANIEYEVPEIAADSIDETVDYAKVAAFVISRCQERQFKTLEGLVSDVGASLKAEFPRMGRLSLTIGKIAPPAPFIIESVGVQREWRD